MPVCPLFFTAGSRGSLVYERLVGIAVPMFSPLNGWTETGQDEVAAYYQCRMHEPGLATKVDTMASIAVEKGRY